MLKLTDKRRRKYIEEYRSRPEFIEQERKYRKEYNSRPKSKKLMSERNTRYRITHKKEINEYARKHAKKYYSTPEVKERKREYDRQRYLKNKQKN